MSRTKLKQTVNNACASVALLNIVNNSHEIEMGENLQQFKDFTANFSPALRGDAIGNFDFVKTVHNSFARYVVGGDLSQPLGVCIALCRCLIVLRRQSSANFSKEKWICSLRISYSRMRLQRQRGRAREVAGMRMRMRVDSTLLLLCQSKASYGN